MDEEVLAGPSAVDLVQRLAGGLAEEDARRRHQQPDHIGSVLLAWGLDVCAGLRRAPIAQLKSLSGQRVVFQP